MISIVFNKPLTLKHFLYAMHMLINLETVDLTSFFHFSKRVKLILSISKVVIFVTDIFNAPHRSPVCRCNMCSLNPSGVFARIKFVCLSDSLSASISALCDIPRSLNNDGNAREHNCKVGKLFSQLARASSIILVHTLSAADMPGHN